VNPACFSTRLLIEEVVARLRRRSTVTEKTSGRP
jgi:hypothetical protein